MAEQPLGPSGPMCRGLLTTTGTQDVDLIPLAAQWMNMHEVPFCFDFHVSNVTLECSNWLEKFWATTNAPDFNKPMRIHCKTDSLSARLVFETRAKCQDFVARYIDDGIPHAVDSPFCNTSTYITVRQSKPLEDRNIGRRFAPLWEALAAKLYENFPERDSNDFFIVPALDARSQIHSNLDRRNGVGKPVFKLAPPEHEHPFDLTASDLCVPRIADDVLRQVIRQASHLAQNRAVHV